MESLKKAHYKEISRTKIQIEYLQEEKGVTVKTFDKLAVDEGFYKNSLKYESDGTKSNPIQLNNFAASDSEAIGKQVIQIYKEWKPQEGESETKQIGKLYDFGLYVKKEREAFQKDGMYQYRYSNSFYAQRGQDGIKYSYNGGTPNVDNPKLAARYFLSAIDRVEHLKEKYQKSLKEVEGQLPKLQQLILKPFGKENELQQMKSKLSGIEREITLKIQENQLKQENPPNGSVIDDNTEFNAVIPLIASNKEMQKEKTKTISIAESDSDNWQQKSFAKMRQNRRMKF